MIELIDSIIHVGYTILKLGLVFIGLFIVLFITLSIITATITVINKRIQESKRTKFFTDTQDKMSNVSRLTKKDSTH